MKKLQSDLQLHEQSCGRDLPKEQSTMTDRRAIDCSNTTHFFDDVYIKGTRAKNLQADARQCGRSMVEMLGVLAIIGVLSVGGIAGYSKAMNKYKINKTVDQISQIVANARTAFSSQGDYEGLDSDNNTNAQSLGIFPNDMISGNKLVNPFKGDVGIKQMQGSKDAGRNNSFILMYAGLSQEACITLTTSDWGSDTASGLIGISAGNWNQAANALYGLASVYIDDTSEVTLKDGYGIFAPGATGYSTPVTVAQATQACSGGDSDASDYAVFWKYM